MTLARKPAQTYRDFLPDRFRKSLGVLRTSNGAPPGHVVMTGGGSSPVIVVGDGDAARVTR